MEVILAVAHDQIECLLITRHATSESLVFALCLSPKSMPYSSNSLSCLKKPSLGSTTSLLLLTNSKAYQINYKTNNVYIIIRNAELFHDIHNYACGRP